MAQVVLLTTTMARWPVAIKQRSFAQASPSEVSGDLSQRDSNHHYWLGYASPVDCLHQALISDAEPDITSLFNRWQEEVALILRLKRAQPQTCLLLNLPRLTESAIEELLSSSQAPGEHAPEEHGDQTDSPWSVEPSALVKFVISQRRDLIQLYADLEAQADLLGREPEFELNLPSVSDPGLGAELLLEWQQQRRQADSLNDRTTELVEALRLSESRLAAEISRSAEIAAEAVAQLQDSEQEKELILLQLKQVQDELVNTFQTLQSYQSNNRQLEENVPKLQQQHDSLQSELEGLAQECRHLFLHSQLLDTVDRTRLRRIQQLMRQSLQT